MAITKIILQQMVTMDQNSITASKYPKYTIVLGNTISSITAAELTSAIESSKASAAAAKQSEINAKQSELNAKDSENEAEISAASSQQSATQSASSATASANSAKAAKTSETNAKASETAAKTSETNAKASETAAKTSETNANSSKTAAAASASAAKTSETNAAASASAAKTSETNANSSKTAAANSASAAKTSETNAAASAKTSETNAAASAESASNSKASRDEAGTFATQATNAATAARESQTSANNSANIASQAVTTIQGLKDTAVSAASQAETSARQASTHAGAASSSAAAAKTDANKAKVEADRAKAEADRASANSYTISFSGGAGWFKLATVTMPQSTSTVSIKMVGGKGYNVKSPQQAGITELVLRAGNGRPKGLSGSLWRRTTEGFSSMAWINTSGDVYDVYVEIGNYATAVNLQVNYTTNASVVLHSQPQYYATKPEGLTTCTIYDLYNPLLPPPDDGTSLKKAQNLSDLPDKSQARTNLRLDRFRQFVEAGETQVKCADETKHIYIKNTGEWGAWDNSRGLSLALPITQGGTGGLSISEAKTNLQIPSVGGGEWLTLDAPPGVEAGKYYPVIIDLVYSSLYASGAFIDVKTRSSAGSDPMNCCFFNGFVRCGGWSDRKDGGYGYFNNYAGNEIAMKCILSSSKNAERYIAVYIEGRGFPVQLRVPAFCGVTVPTSNFTYKNTTYAWGTANPATDSTDVLTMFDFSLNRIGFYQATTEGNYYIGNGERIVLSNGMSVGDELSLQAPKISFSGTVAAGNGFIADGTSVPNATFYSRYRIGDVVYGAEFRAAENAAQVIVRDPAGTSHQFFNFNLNGTFSPPNGLLTSTGTDWNGQKNTNNKFYGIAGSGNAPENATYGGVHVGFSGNYATQFAGRNSKFWVRSIEAGENKEWLKLITATLAPKTPTDARDGFISDSGVGTSWAPSSGGGFQSSYAENRIMQSWVDGSGRLYSRFLTTNQPTTSKTVAPWKSAAMLELNNRFTGNNTFTGALESTGDITCARLFSKGAIQTESGGIELYHPSPFIDFHFNKATSDYTARIINDAANQLTFDCQNVRTLQNFTAHGLVRSCNNDAFVAWPTSDPSASHGQIRIAPRFQSRFNSIGSDSSGAARMAMWFEEHVGSNHRAVIEVSGYGAPVKYWHFRSDGAIWNSVKGEVTWGGTSDLRYKDNVVAYDGLQSLENIKAMNLIKFTYKDDDRKRERRGVAAQQIMEIDPCYVKKSEGSYIDANGEQVNIEKLVLDTNPLLMDALCAIKVLSSQVGELKEENADLRADTTSREEQITALESEVSDLKKQIADLTLVVNSLLANRA